MIEQPNFNSYTEEKDFSRPTFIRKTGEIGIFIDVYDAEALDKQLFGSRQYFLMNLVDAFYKDKCQGELYKIKGFFYKRNLLNDITLEYFHPGTLLIINTNSKKALDDLVKNYENGQLNKAFVECFVTEKSQEKLEVKNLKLKIKIFYDEVELVKKEWEIKLLPQPYLIACSKKDMRMIYIVKKYQQKSLFRNLNKLREDASKYKCNIGEFLLYLKLHCEIDQQPIKNIIDLEFLNEEFSKNPHAKLQLYLLTNYMQIISDLRNYIRDIETHILFSLSQIRIGCESEGQRNVNKSIQKNVAYLKAAFREKTLFKSNQENFCFLSNSDMRIWGGMIYFIPTMSSLIRDIDQQIDDYLQLGNFNQFLVEYENKYKKH